MDDKDAGVIDRLPDRREIGQEIVRLDARRRWLRSLYKLRCRIDEQSERTATSNDEGGRDE